MFEKMIAVEHFDWFKERENQGVSNNNLVHESVANNLCIHSWVKFNRLNKELVSKEINEANLKNRLIAISYHKESEFHDAYENYVSVERAIELIENENLFVFKFIVLSKRISDEYNLHS